MEGLFDWNTLSLDKQVEYLRNKYRFSSSGDAFCINSLIDFYEKKSVNKTELGNHLANVIKESSEKLHSIENIHSSEWNWVAGEKTLAESILIKFC